MDWNRTRHGGIGFVLRRIAFVECPTPSRRFFSQVILAVWLALEVGCAAPRVRWREPVPSRARTGFHFLKPPPVPSNTAAAEPLLEVERLYGEALALERAGEAACVDLYFEAALLASTAAVNADANDPHLPRTDSECAPRLDELSRSALVGLVTCGQRFGRFDPRSHLLVYRSGQPHSIPVTHHGFVWHAADFLQVTPVGDYTTNAFRVAHRRAGCGIPLVVTTCGRGRPLLAEEPVFAATLLLRTGHAPTAPMVDAPNATADGAIVDSTVADSTFVDGAGEGDGISLALFDPLRVDDVLVGGESRPLAKDLSAPLAYRLRDQRPNLLDDFLIPSYPEAESRLIAIEPYQPGKVPVVFVHGLLSDPFTWAEAVNELVASKGFVDHFQIWLFEYPTGQPFLFSAATLRKELAQAAQTFDPEGTDPGFSQMVLVGHSMGGLISKLQVTASGDRLWRSVANRPFEQTLMQPRMRARLRESFFFAPSERVARVVFIATPHQGSAQARRLIGRVASSLVAEPAEMRENHRQLVDSNPGVFSSEFARRVPTSIDLLDPNSRLLQALNALPLAEDVVSHSVIGDIGWTIGYGPSDGVVPVTSARYREAVSERYVATRHSELHKHVDTIDELQRILAEHLQAPSTGSR